MTVLKARVGADWVTIGGVATGVPPGGTTGQILTKTSAADYATAWASTLPILANNTYLQGYRADGTTAQSLIGMTAADEITIGQSLAAGKNIYVPRLTVQGELRLTTGQQISDTSGRVVLWPHTDANIYLAHNGNLIINQDAGESTFVRSVYFNTYVEMRQNLAVAGTLYKGPPYVAYTHPDFVFEHAYTGRIEKFAEATGAQDYTGLLPLDAVERHTRETLRLPGARNEKYDLFARGDELLAEVEKIMLYLFDHERRLRALERRA